LQLLKELLPKLSRIALLVRATSPATAQYVKEAELAARTLGIQLQILTVRDPGDFEGAFSAAQGATRLADLALKNRLPTISGLSEMVEGGGLMSYGHTMETCTDVPLRRCTRY
jgi:putative ABC transport system substrate-binding protein